MGDDETDPASYDVRNATPQPGDPIVDGLPDVGGAEAHAQRAAAGRASHDAPAVAQVAAVQPGLVPSSATHSAVEVSATTDPHHDQGSAATGHVEDATPAETAIAEPPVEATHDAETPPHDEPAAEVATPVEVAVPAEAHHDAAATAEPDHTGD